MAGKFAALAPFLAVMAMVLVPGICGAAEGLSGAGRFVSRGGGSAHGRKLLNFDLCTGGSDPNNSCKSLFPFFKTAACCTAALNTKICKDLSIDFFNCGSCGKSCVPGEVCCSGVCSDILSDRNNCLICGKKCSGNLPCRYGLCGYNGF